ncbi:hypothetical protein SAMN05216281_101132 [Cryobacterium luteum]|nr:hypothetical protein SAMN05216281_101132 [Cryobacterium luteum]
MKQPGMLFYLATVSTPCGAWAQSEDHNGY